MGLQYNSQVTGVFNGIHYYKWRDKYCKRVMPTRERLTDATIEQASIFGVAAKASRLIRNQLTDMIPVKDRALMHVINNGIARGLRDRKEMKQHPILTQVELNTESSMLHLVGKCPLLVRNESKTDFIIPALKAVHVKAPYKSRLMIWNLHIVYCNYQTLEIKDFTTRSIISFSDDMPCTTIALPMIQSPHIISVVAASVNFSITENRSGLITESCFRPSMIIEATID